MTNILEISDGKTTPINLLSTGFGFCLNTWSPAIAQPKGGGVFQSSSLSEGRKLVNREFEDVQEAFNFDIKGGGQPETITYISNLIQLLQQATEYWTGTANKVWIKAKADCEDSPRYALISSYSWPELKFLYGSTFFNASTSTQIASMSSVDLGIEHKLWSTSIPGESECTEISSIQDWQYTELWRVNTTLPSTFVNALLQTVNGDIYAGDNSQILRSQDNGVSWFVNTTLPAGLVSSLIQTINGDIYASDFAQILRSQDNGASWFVNTTLPFDRTALLQTTPDEYIYAGDVGQILRSVDNGASWVVNTTLPKGLIEFMIQTANGDIYAGDDRQILRSQNNGATWNINTTLPVSSVLSLLQTTNGDIYAGDDTIIIRSQDNGATWKINFVLPAASSAVALLQTTNGDIYAGGINRIFRSKNNGTTWNIDTELPNTIRSLLQTANGDIYAGDAGDILRSVIAIVEMGRNSTCNNEVYVANKQNIGNLTHVKIDDGSVFTDIFPIISFPQTLLPAVPIVNDAIYFGQEAAITNAGPFSGLVFDLDDVVTFTVSYTIIYEYSDGAAGWPALTITDNTDVGDGSLRNLGVSSIHWIQPSDWIAEAVDGVTAFWVRARLSAKVGTITPPTQQNRDIYTIVLAYVNVAELQIKGDISALIKEQLQNQSDKDGRGGAAPNLWDNRIICGLRNHNRGSLFQAYLNASDVQNPVGVTVADTGANATFTTDTSVPTGRQVTYNPAGVEAMTTQVTISLDAAIARDFYGKFHAFLRVQRTAGGITNFDVQLQFVSGSGGIEFTTVSKQIQTTTAFEMLDFGQIQLPVGGTFKLTDLGDVTEIRIQASAASGTPNLIIYDLILIPVDEWSIDSADFANTDDSIVGRSSDLAKLLDVDSITNPRIDIQSLVRLVDSEQITSVYDPISPGKAILQDKTQQRLWFLAAQTDITGTVTAWISPPEIAHSVQLFKNERYLTLSEGVT